MATFTNISGAKLVVNNEFGLPVSFEISETKNNVSNYLERFTSTFQSGEDIMLLRVGNLDPEIGGDGVPTAVIEEENMAVRPSQSNDATQGVAWGAVGGVRSADIPRGYVDTEGTLNNTATRLQRVGLDTELDIAARQIVTRELGVKNILSIAVKDSETFTGAALDQGGGADRAFTLGTAGAALDPPIQLSGRVATAADAANALYGSLLTEGQYYTAFGSLVFDDAGGGTTLVNVGFAISALTATLTDATCGGHVTSLTATMVASTGIITWVRTGGASADEIAMVCNYTQAQGTGAIVDGNYDSTDNIRGWYEVPEASVGTNVGGVLMITDAGIYDLLESAVNFTVWS